jgi:hypothetical protein
MPGIIIIFFKMLKKQRFFSLSKCFVYDTLFISLRQLVRYENERPELIFSTKKKRTDI